GLWVRRRGRPWRRVVGCQRPGQDRPAAVEQGEIGTVRTGVEQHGGQWRLTLRHQDSAFAESRKGQRSERHDSRIEASRRERVEVLAERRLPHHPDQDLGLPPGNPEDRGVPDHFGEIEGNRCFDLRRQDLLDAPRIREGKGDQVRRHQRTGEGHRDRVIAPERRSQLQRRQAGPQPLGRRPIRGQRGGADFLDGEAAEAALQRRHAQRVLRPIQANVAVHQSSFQYNILPIASSYRTTAVTCFSVRPTRPVAVMRKVSLVDPKRFAAFPPWRGSISGRSRIPFACRMETKSCADIPKKENIFRIWISWRMVWSRRGSRSAGSLAFVAAIRMLVSICCGSSVLTFSLELMSGQTVRRSPNAAMNRSFTPRTMNSSSRLSRRLFFAL